MHHGQHELLQWRCNGLCLDLRWRSRFTKVFFERQLLSFRVWSSLVFVLQAQVNLCFTLYTVFRYYTDPVCATETTGTAFLLDQCYGQYDGTTMISQKYSTSSSQVLSASTYASTVLCAGTSSIDYVTADVCRAITGQYSMVELYKSHGIRGFGVNSKLIAFLIFYVSATILFF